MSNDESIQPDTDAVQRHIDALRVNGPWAHDIVDLAKGELYSEVLDAPLTAETRSRKLAGLGHLFGMHWAAERVIDYRTRMLSDRQKIVNLHLALMNDGFFQMSLGYFLISAVHGPAEIDSFLAALERALHAVDLV